MIPSGVLVYYGKFKFYFDKYGIGTTFPSHINNIGDLTIFTCVDEVPLLYIEDKNYDGTKISSLGEDWNVVVDGKVDIINRILTLFNDRPKDVVGYLFNTAGNIILTRNNENKLVLSSEAKIYQIVDKASMANAIAGLSKGKCLFRVNNVYKMFNNVNNKNFQMLFLPVLLKLHFKQGGENLVSEEFAYLTFLSLCSDFNFDIPSTTSFKWNFKDISPLYYMKNTNPLNVQRTERLKHIVNGDKDVNNKIIVRGRREEPFIPYRLVNIFDVNEKTVLLSEFLSAKVIARDDCTFSVDVDLLGDYVDIKKDDIVFMGIKAGKLYIALSSMYNYGEFYDETTLENLLTLEFLELEVSIYKVGGGGMTL